MVRDGSHYWSYLLRLWLASERGKPVWRASLQSPHTGERVSFCTLDGLFAFLRQQTDQTPNLQAAVPDSSKQRRLYQDDPADRKKEKGKNE